MSQLIIVGGMGKKASLYFLNRCIRDLREIKPLVSYYDYQVTDRSEYILGIKSSNPGLEMAELIQDKINLRGKKNILCVPCNTFHSENIWQPFCSLMKRRFPRIQIVNMLDILKNNISDSNIRIGILCTLGSRKSGIFDNVFSDYDIIYPSLSDQEKIHEIIYSIKNDQINNSYAKAINDIARKMVRLGAQKNILGCTELPIIIKHNDFFYDPMYFLIQYLKEALL